MSSWGRAQDTLEDLLWGYDINIMGDRQPGLLEPYLKRQDVPDLVEPILEALYRPIFEDGKHQQRFEDASLAKEQEKEST